MKTAIYIDEDLYKKAEDFSYVCDVSRSKLYCTAINEYIQNHSGDSITERLNAYYSTHESKLDEGFRYAAYRILDRVEW